MRTSDFIKGMVVRENAWIQGRLILRLIERGLYPMAEPRLFTIIRHADESGVSGTGRVLDGIVWHNGKVTVCWRTGPHSSIAVYDSFEIFKAIHIDSHPTNGTEIIWRS